MGRTDVFVIGGGPAGLAAAIAARKRGFSVILADGAEPPIDKPCGEGLMPDGVAALRALNVLMDHSLGRPFRGIRFLGEGCEVSASFAGGPGLGLRRTVLHEKMIERAERAGVILRWKTSVTGLGARDVEVNGKTVAARYIIGADGMRSRVRRWAGLDQPLGGKARYAFRAHYGVRPWTDVMELYWGRGGQAYVTPVNDQEVCVVLTAQRAQLRHSAIAGEFPALAERLQGAKASPERGEITVTRTFRRVKNGNIALVGDASGTVDAITGEGLCLGFQQANALGEALQAGDLRVYQESHEQLIRKPILMGRLLLLMDRYPLLRRHAVGFLASRPAVFARMVSMHIGAERSAQSEQAEMELAWGVRMANGVAGSSGERL